MGSNLVLSRRGLVGAASVAAAGVLAACDQTETVSACPDVTRATAAPEVIPSPEDLAARPEAINADYPPQLEEQQGDPDVARERIWVDPALVLAAAYPGGTRASFAPRITDFNERILQVANTFIGVSRDNERSGEIERMLQLYGLSMRDSAGKYVPYCAAGVSFCSALAYREQQAPGGETTVNTLKPLLGEVEHFHFYPSPSVQDMYFTAKGKRQWREERATPSPTPGWLVIYDFVGRPSHVGIVESSTPTMLSTIEFNTRKPDGVGSERDGGVVTRRERERGSSVLGYVATNLRPPWS